MTGLPRIAFLSILAAGLLLLAQLGVPPARANAPGTPEVTYGVLPVHGPQAAPPGPAPQTPPPLPFRVPDFARYQQEKSAQQTATAGASARGGPLITVSAPAPSPGTTISGLSNPTATPPDTQIAAGPNYVIEMINSSAAIWTKSGTFVQTVSLRSLFAVPAANDGGSDPRVVYDTQTARFFAAYISYQTTGAATSIHAAWSTDSTPFSWLTCEYADNGFLHDNPAIGLSDDKEAIGSNVFPWPSSPTTPPAGSDTLILDKLAMVQRGSCAFAYLAPVATGIIRPAHSLGQTSTLYMVSLPELGGSTATLWSVTGNPSSANVVRSGTGLPMPATSLPPDAVQPGTRKLITTNDARALEAIWKAGVLYVAANDGCVPTGDSVMRSCLRIMQIATGTPSVTNTVDIGAAGAYLYYPSIRPDASNDMDIVYTMSSSSVFASVAAAVLDPTWSSISTATIKPGATTYAGADTAPYRWGDYSGAAADPSDGNSVWIAGEYAASGSTNGWGTFIAQLHTGSATPCYDINGDGVVNGLDLWLLAKHFLQISGDPAFLPAADLNHDGVINGLDLNLLASRFATAC